MRRSTRDPSPGRLWTSAAFISPTVTAAQALGHALKSPGLSGPPPWARGSIHQQLNPPADMSCTHGCSQWHGIKLHVTTLDNGRVPLRKIIEVHHGKLHQHRAERSAVGGTRKCVHRFTILLSVSDASALRRAERDRALCDRIWVGECARDAGVVGTDTGDTSSMLTD